MRSLLSFAIIVAAALLLTDACQAQNVSGYSTIPEPFLFLLREPVVQEDLGLSPAQRSRLIEINHAMDGDLLASRNMPAEKSQTVVADVITETRSQVERLFSAEQKERMRQIAYRIRGISFVRMPDAAEQLELTARQSAEIESIVKRTKDALKELQTETYQGPESHRAAQDAMAAARKKEQQEILGILDDGQRRRLVSLIGRPFELQRLGQVSFLAPELAQGDQWLNSKPLRLADLRGKVIALHFYAFG